MSFPVFISIPSRKSQTFVPIQKLLKSAFVQSKSTLEQHHEPQVGTAAVGLLTAQSRGKGKELQIPLKSLISTKLVAHLSGNNNF